VSARSRNGKGARKRPASTAAAPIGADPIHALIEKHRAAYFTHLRIARVLANTEPRTAGYQSLQIASNGAWEAAGSAALDIIGKRPVSHDGVLALLDYVQHFTDGVLWLPGADIGDWQSGPSEWPQVDGGGFVVAVLRCVRLALRDLGGGK
jgi:hypothetical protein